MKLKNHWEDSKYLKVRYQVEAMKMCKVVEKSILRSKEKDCSRYDGEDRKMKKTSKAGQVKIKNILMNHIVMSALRIYENI